MHVWSARSTPVDWLQPCWRSSSRLGSVRTHWTSSTDGHCRRRSLRVLIAAAVVGIGGAAIIGVIESPHRAPLIAFIAIGVLLAVAYNLELFDGRLHTDFVFAAAWGAFPVLTGYYAQHEQLDVAAIAAAVFAYFLSAAQRSLSTPARSLRRKTADVRGTIVTNDGTSSDIERATLLAPLEGALRALSWAAVWLAAALAFARLRPWP